MQRERITHPFVKLIAGGAQFSETLLGSHKRASIQASRSERR